VLGTLVVLSLLAHIRYFIYSGPGLKGYDGQYYYVFVRSALLDGDLDFENEFSSLVTFPEYIAGWESRRSETGLIGNPYPIGYALLSVPFFGLAHGVTHLHNALLTTAWPPNGYSAAYQFLVPLGHWAYACLGMVFVYLICRRFYGQRTALAATVVAWLGTAAIFYVVVGTYTSHPASLMTISAFILVVVHARASGSVVHWAAAGALGGLAALVRYQNGAFLIVPAVILLPSTARLLARRDWACLGRVVFNGLMVMLCFALVFSPQLVVWQILFGRVRGLGYNEQSIDWLHPTVWETIFSPSRGLIFWTPAVVVAFLAVPFFLRGHRGWLATGLVLGFVVQAYINCGWTGWGGRIFGARAFTNSTYLYALGFCAAAEALRRIARRFAPALFALLIAWNVLWQTQYAVGLIPHTTDSPLRTCVANQWRLVYYGLRYRRLPPAGSRSAPAPDAPR